MTGRMYDEFSSQMAAIGVFIGFNLTFFPQFVMGARGMPRRYADYLPEYEFYHQLSTIGAFVLGVALVAAVGILVRSLWTGAKAPPNPWGSATLEWQCSSPPPHDNFATTPEVGDPYAVESVKWSDSERGYVKNPSYVPSKDH